MQTVLIYSTLFISTVFFSYYAGMKKKRRYLIVAAILLSMVAGLRGSTVGIDTQGYVHYFELIAHGKTQYVYGMEPSFIAICKVLLYLLQDTSILLLIFALITNILIFLRIWDFRKYISLPWTVTVYFGIFYFMTFNIMRQFVAVAIVFWSTRYLQKKSYIKFILAILIASLFHNSALLGLLFFCFEITAWKYLNRAQKRLLTCAILCAPLALYYIMRIALRYQGYFSSVSSSIGLMVLVKFLLFILLFITARRLISIGKDEELDTRVRYSELMVHEYYLAGLGLTTIGYYFSYMDRLGLYFYLFETIYIGMVMKSRRVHVLIKMVITVLYCYILIGSMFGSGHGQGNYMFFWQM